MNGWIYFFVTRPIATIAMYCFIFISGLSTLFIIPIEAEPEVSRNEMYVSVNYSSSLDGVLNSVAIPIEKKFLAIPGLDLLKTDVTNNNINFSLVFAQDSDMNTNMIKVQSAISEARADIPENAIISIPPIKENNTKIMTISFSSKSKKPEEIIAFVNKFKSVFETTDGVSAAILGSDQNADICNIMLRPAEMHARNISFHDIRENLKSFYIQGGSSDITVGNNNIALEIGYEDEQDLLKHPISSYNNNNVYLYEIADIQKGNQDKKESFSYRLDGQKVVNMIIYKKQEANLISVCKAVRAKHDQIKQACLKNDININIVQDQSIFVNNGIHSIYHTILESVVLVSIIIFLFLRSIVLAIIPIIAIPVSVIPTFCLMSLFGVSINTFSLFGVVVGIGLVVDDAIVVIENIHKYMHEGASKLDASIKGTSQILLSIISMTITLAIVYLPILVTSDPYIKAFFDFAFVISVSVMFSGLVSITLTPMLYYLLYRESPKTISVPKAGFMERLEYIYLKMLCKLILNRYLVFYVFTTVAICSIVLLLKSIKYEEEINVDKGFISYTYSYKTDNNLDINYVDNKLLEFYKTIAALPISKDIKHIVTSVSQNDTSTNFIDIILVDHAARKYNIKQITDAIDEQINLIPTDISIFSSQGIGNELAARVNMQIYEERPAHTVSSIMTDFVPIREITDRFLTIDVRPNTCYMLTINKDICRLYGVVPYTISEVLTSIKHGKYFRESASSTVNKISFGLSCDQQEEQLQKILDMPIRGHIQDDNKNISKIYTLKNFATVKTKQQVSKYHRISGNPGMTFTMILKPGKSIRDLKLAIDKFNTAHAGAAYAEVNVTELRRLKSMDTIFRLAVLSVIFIYLLLSALFESFLKPLIILSIVPASAAGGLLLLYIFKLKINTISIIGIITLVGLITKHGIMLMDYISKHESETPESDMLMIEACLNRFRPILMTTACMILGAIPLVIKTNVELIEYKMPVALVIIGGTAVGTIVTLLILPIYYVVIQDIIFNKPLIPTIQYLYVVQNRLRKKHKDEQ